MNLLTIRKLVEDEFERASRLHPTPMFTPHEGYAIILEEVRELEAEVFRNPVKGIPLTEQHERNIARAQHKHAMATEAVQLAAMCVRFLAELMQEPNDGEVNQNE